MGSMSDLGMMRHNKVCRPPCQVVSQLLTLNEALGG